MRGFRIGLALASVATLASCSGEASKVFVADQGQVAYIRFVNAIPDSGAGDWRFVDAVEGSPTTLNLPFRGIFPGATYQSANAGVRHLKIFQSALDQTFADPNLTSPAVVSTVFLDSAFTLTAGTHYTIIAVGNLRAPKTAKFVILTDNFVDPTAYVAVRQPGYVEAYRVAGAVPVRISTTSGISATNSSATFDVSEHSRRGALLRRSTFVARVAG